MPPTIPPVGYRIRQGETIVAYVWSADNVILGGHFRVLYDDGSLEDWTLDQLTTGTSRARLQMFSNRTATGDGYVIAGGFTFQGGTKTKYGMTYAQAGIAAEPSADETWRGTLCQGYVYFGHTLSIGEFKEPEPWTLYLVQGTVIEDATAGTHLSSLTVSPANGSEMILLYWNFKAGAGAANLLSVNILDALGGNIITREAVSLSLASGETISGPFTGAAANSSVLNVSSFILISNGMAITFTVSTATVSLTHTFAAAFLVRGGVKPTATLADTIGTPTLTKNTDAFFGVVQPT